MNNNNKKRKLFVAGTDDSNPNNWSVWDEISVVLALDGKEAEEITGKSPVVEIDTTKSCELYSVHEPNLGEDL